MIDRVLRLFVHLMAAMALVLVPTLWVGRPAWNPRGPTTWFALLFAATYLAVVLPTLLGRRAAEPGLARVVLHGLAAFGVVLFILTFAQWRFPVFTGAEFPARIALSAFALGMLLLVSLFAIRTAAVWKLIVLAAVLLAAFWGHYAMRSRPKAPPAQEIAHVDTSLYVVKTTSYRKWISDGDTRGGAIAPFGGGYLLAAGDGWLYYIAENDSKTAPVIEKLSYRVPYNPDEFRNGGRRILGDQWLDNSMDKLRVADLLVQMRAGDAFRLFVSHHYWKPDEACFVVRVSALEGTARELQSPEAELVWRTVYETSPCLPLNTEGRRGMRFGGLQIGGALALLGEDELLLTVGDHEFDGFKRPEALPQQTANSYGKTILIRLVTGDAELYTLGHRNPQGLYVASDGTAWVLEHGPRGGDELNRIRRGANYGWPAVTYGTDYRLHVWPPNPTPGRHDGFEKPALAFVPSIAVSQLAGVRGELFQAWRGDLLVGSFFGGLIRTRVEDDRVIFTEAIRIPGRIRDIAEGADGRILVWTDENDLVFLEPAASGSAESLISQCIVCHTMGENETIAAAPSLRGVVGRNVATVKGYDYSQAMTRFGGRWTTERLDRFIADPRGTVPGTTMAFEGIDDAGERKRIVEFLERRDTEETPR
jgi:cytochrome c2